MLVSMRSTNVASAAMSSDAGCAAGSWTGCPRMSMPASYNACARLEGDAKKRTVASTRVSAALMQSAHLAVIQVAKLLAVQQIRVGFASWWRVCVFRVAHSGCRRLLRHSHKHAANAVREATPPVVASVKIQRRYMYQDGGRACYDRNASMRCLWYE